MMHRSLFAALTIALRALAFAQPDSLFIPEGTSVKAYAVIYTPLQTAGQYRRTGHFTYDTTHIAVYLDYKRGKPCGIYRAYYPDGRPLIFAVYGWGWLNGDWTEYDQQGRISTKGQYTEGERDGKWAFRSEGIVGHYKKGKKNGKWRYYENDHLVRVEKYHQDKLLPNTRFHFGEH